MSNFSLNSMEDAGKLQFFTLDSADVLSQSTSTPAHGDEEDEIFYSPYSSFRQVVQRRKVAEEKDTASNSCKIINNRFV